MNISEAVSEFIEVLDAYSDSTLKEKENLKTLIQLAGDNKNHASIGDLSFHGKYLWRLYHTFQKEPTDSDKYEKLELEFMKTVSEFGEKIQSVIAAAPDDIVTLFQNHFFAMSHESLHHLLSLAHDFYYLKNWELEYVEENSESRVVFEQNLESGSKKPSSQ